MIDIIHGHRVRTIPIVDVRVGQTIVHAASGHLLVVVHKTMVNGAVTLRDADGDLHTVRVETYHDAHVLVEGEGCDAETHTAACRSRHDRSPMSGLVADAVESVEVALRVAPPGHGRELLEQALDELEQAAREFRGAS